MRISDWSSDVCSSDLTKVLMSFASSDAVAAQVIHGAPMDIFASADQQAMDKALAAGSIDTATRRDFARNEVVLIVPADRKLGIHSVADLQSASVKRVDFGNPATVPLGRYTKAALEHPGNWDPDQKNKVTGQKIERGSLGERG